MGAGAGNVCCPPAIQPPTPQLSKSAALIPVLILALVAGQAFTFFIYIFLGIFLIMGWRGLNWCSVMFFFLYCLMQILTNTIQLVGYIQYDRFFSKKYMLTSIYLLVAEIYFIIAVFLSHYVYKRFKAYLSMGFFQQNNNINQNLNDNQNLNQNNNIQGNPFQGQGVRIG